MRVFLEISVRLKLTVPLAAGAIGLAINSLPVMAGDGAMPIGEPASPSLSKLCPNPMRLSLPKSRLPSARLRQIPPRPHPRRPSRLRRLQ